jgi:hypothetical protein
VELAASVNEDKIVLADEFVVSRVMQNGTVET